MNITKKIMIILLINTGVAQASNLTPYAGQEQRSIKALSASEIQGLLAGKGMGMAKAAELNHYPGPLHVLEVKKDIGLSKEQEQQTQLLFDAMKKEAVRVGRLIVEQEQSLEKEFSTNTITDERLKAGLKKLAELRGELRYIHLRTHLKQKRIMTDKQIKQYDHARGYMNNNSHHGHHGH